MILWMSKTFRRLHFYLGKYKFFVLVLLDLKYCFSTIYCYYNFIWSWCTNLVFLLMKTNYKRLQNANTVKIFNKLKEKLQVNELILILSPTLCESVSAFNNVKITSSSNIIFYVLYIIHPQSTFLILLILFLYSETVL